MGWSQDLVPKRWKRRTESQTTGKRPLSHKPQHYRNIFLFVTHVSFLQPLSLTFIFEFVCVHFAKLRIQADTPLLFSRVLLMLHPLLDVFSR